MKRDDFTWLNVPAEEAARRLLGCELIREIEGREVRVRIVETEAYDQGDEASHTYRGRTKRNDAMFKSAGHMYVYFTYGMHYCCNIVVGEEGYGAGVLIRAIEPLEGEEIMLDNRHGRGGKLLSNGPGKVCQAMAIDKAFNGHDLTKSPLQLVPKRPLPAENIIATPRIGISKAKDTLWRFVIKQ